MDYEKEISFGAFDSELMRQEIYIPEGFEATIDGNKIILKKIENEDERIRKGITSILEHYKESGEVVCPYPFVSIDEALAWLEKQANHANFRNKIQIGDKVTRNRDGVLVNLSQLNRVAKKDENQGESYTKKDVDDAFVEGMAFAKNELEKQSEQKLPIEKLPSEMKTIGESLGFTTQEECDEYNQMVSDLIMSDNDKVEPKFHEGDWVVITTTKGIRVVQIASVEYFNKDGYPSYITTEGRWFGKGTKARLLTDKDVETITIPERSAIVKKIKSWSEEDDMMIGRIRNIVEKYAFSQSAVDVNGDLCEKEYIDADNWLKSLKERIGG